MQLANDNICIAIIICKCMKGRAKLNILDVMVCVCWALWESRSNLLLTSVHVYVAVSLPCCGFSSDHVLYQSYLIKK